MNLFLCSSSLSGKSSPGRKIEAVKTTRISGETISVSGHHNAEQGKSYRAGKQPPVEIAKSYDSEQPTVRMQSLFLTPWCCYYSCVDPECVCIQNMYISAHICIYIYIIYICRHIYMGMFHLVFSPFIQGSQKTRSFPVLQPVSMPWAHDSWRSVAWPKIHFVKFQSQVVKTESGWFQFMILQILQALLSDNWQLKMKMTS